MGDAMGDGDLVCPLQGASMQSIIKPHKDYSTPVLATLTVDSTWAEGWASAKQNTTEFPHQVLLTWSWDSFPESDDYRSAVRLGKAQEILDLVDEAGRIWSVAHLYRIFGSDRLLSFRKVLHGVLGICQRECS